MKFLYLSTLLLLCWSCGSDASQAATNTEADTETAAAPAESPVKAPTQLEHPCETVAWTDVASTFGWEGTNESIPTTMSEGRLQGCYYAPPKGAESVTISVTQSTERTISAKYLENAFKKDLASTDGNHEQVAADLGDQAIYNYGKNGPNYTYRLRWRDGNEVDYFVEFKSSQEMDAAAILPKLQQLAEML